MRNVRKHTSCAELGYPLVRGHRADLRYCGVKDLFLPTRRKRRHLGRAGAWPCVQLQGLGSQGRSRERTADEHGQLRTAEAEGADAVRSWPSLSVPYRLDWGGAV